MWLGFLHEVQLYLKNFPFKHNNKQLIKSTFDPAGMSQWLSLNL